MNAIDCELTYEELYALFESKDIDLTKLEEAPLDEASPFGRNFARSGGVTQAVAQVMSNNLSAAKQAISKDNSADADYLRAVIAAKEGDLKTAEAQLKSAVSKNPKLAQKAANDINLKALNK